MHTIKITSFVLLLISCACSYRPPSPTPSPTPLPEQIVATTTWSIYPPYLGPVWPAPDSKTNIQDYLDNLGSPREGGVGVSFSIFEASRILADDNYGEKLKQEATAIDARVDLYIDSVLVPRETLVVYSYDLETVTDQNGNLLYKGSSGFDLAWKIPLSPGKHEAKFTVRGITGKTLAYIWTFTLFE